MKAGVLEELERLMVREVDEPALDRGSLVVRVRVCSICGSDLRMYRQGHPRVRLPQVLGHEISGVVEAVGEDVPGYRRGDRVCITPKIPCGRCFYCSKGEYTRCPQGQSFGYQLPGGYAERLLVPSRGVEFGVVSHIGESLSFEEASLAEPLACCIRAQRQSRVSPGDVVVVIGDGPMGLLHCCLARVNGAEKVILIGRRLERLQGVSTTAIDRIIDSRRSRPTDEVVELTEGRGADAVIVACSTGEAQEEALSLAGRGGRVNFFGGLPAGRSRISFDSNLVHYSEVSVQGSHGSTPEENKQAVALLARGAVRVKDLITHIYPLDAIEEAFRLAERKEGMKVAIRL